MKRDAVNYSIVGAVVLLAFALLLATLLTITGRAGRATTYYVVFANVAGLDLGAPVYYEGFRIGQVDAIVPERAEGRTRYRISLAVREDWSIPADSVVQRQSSGLLAAMAIGIREGTSDTLLAAGAELKGVESGDVFSAMNDLATELTLLSRERLRPLVDTLTKRIDSITGTLDTRAPALLSEAQALLQRLNVAADNANAMLAQPNQQAVAELLVNVRDVAAQLDTTRRHADSLLSSLNKTVDENRPALRQSIENLERTVGAVAQRIDAITHHLESASRNVDEFGREIRRSPNRLLFTPAADEVEE